MQKAIPASMTPPSSPVQNKPNEDDHSIKPSSSSSTRAIVMKDGTPSSALTKEKELDQLALVEGANKTNGQFNPHPICKQNYNRSTYKKYQFNGEQALDRLKALYTTIHGAPEFLHKVMHFDRHRETHNASVIENYLTYPHLYARGSEFVMVPHPIYHNLDDLGKQPLQCKHMTGGVSYLSWFVHPEELKGAVNHFNPETFEATKAAFSRSQQHTDSSLSSMTGNKRNLTAASLTF